MNSISKKYFVFAGILFFYFLYGCNGNPEKPVVPPEGPVVATVKFKGVEFNPNVIHATYNGYPFPYFRSYDDDGAYRNGIKAALKDLADNGFNYIAVFLCNLHTMKNSNGIGNAADEPLTEWGNISYLDNFARFLDDCHEAKINVCVDLVDNRWLPYSIYSDEHIGQPDGWWPVAGDTPWEEAATWYSEIINYIESKVRDPEVIAMWTMTGNYQWGGAEPVLWNNGVVTEYAEQFVKYVWPRFVEAGTRPKGAPYIFPILADHPHWNALAPYERLSGITNLHQWLVSDIHLPPDYWFISGYTYCDSADGYSYLEKTSEILRAGNDAKIIYTDFKLTESFRNTILKPDGRSEKWTDMIKWNLDMVDKYGYEGWWIWSYQGDQGDVTGLKTADGKWKDGVLDALFNR